MQLKSSSQRGLGLVELMVGITIGLIVTAGASMVAVNQINEHRRLMLETQIQQDLRTAADLLINDLRRAGFRGTSDHSVWSPAQVLSSLNNKSAQAASPNPYADIAVNANNTMVTYSYARAGSDNGYDASDTVKSNEFAGFKWDTALQTLYLKVGNKSDGQPNWQPITDPAIVQITDFSVDLSAQAISLGDFCDSACGSGALQACPSQKIRKVAFRIVGRAAHDHAVTRTLTGVERVGADALTGACPT